MISSKPWLSTKAPDSYNLLCTESPHLIDYTHFHPTPVPTGTSLFQCALPPTFWNWTEPGKSDSQHLCTINHVPLISTIFHLSSILITLDLHQALVCFPGTQVKIGSEAGGHYLAGAMKRFEMCCLPINSNWLGTAPMLGGGCLG